MFHRCVASVNNLEYCQAAGLLGAFYILRDELSSSTPTAEETEALRGGLDVRVDATKANENSRYSPSAVGRAGCNQTVPFS